MKELTPPFRLYDFLAYMFPGLATLHALYISSVGTRNALTGFLTPNAAFNYAMLIVASYIVGLFWSAISRDVIRRVCWFVYNPRVDFLFPRKYRRTPLSARIRMKIQTELEGLLPSVKLSQRNAYVVCRSYIAQNCPSSWARREIVSSMRAMATNFVGPMVLYAAILFLNGRTWLGGVAAMVALVLLRKTVTHDSIEWKEVYMSFLTHRMVTCQANQSKKEGI